MSISNKVFYTQYGIGTSKYSVSFHDGEKTHKDGSEFFDLKIFKNKKRLAEFTSKLVAEGYKER